MSSDVEERIVGYAVMYGCDNDKIYWWQSDTVMDGCVIPRVLMYSRREKSDSQRRWRCSYNSLRQPHSSPSVSDLPVHAPATSSYSLSLPLSPSITPSLFHSRLKTYLFHKSFPPYTPFRPQDWLHGFMTGPFLLSISVFSFSFFISSFLFGSVRQIKLAIR